MQKVYLIFLFCGVMFSSSGNGLSQSYTVKRLGVENGLSNNYIVDIVQDGQGCIWIATESGLNRFDGQSFIVYRTSNSGLISNELNTLLYDREENKIWIGTQRNGISVFDCATQTFENITNESGLATNDVTHFSPAADGGIWISHYHVGIEHYNKKTGQFTVFRDNEIENMKSLNWCVCDDGVGHLYVGHAQDGLSIIDLQNKTIRNFSHDPNNSKSLPGNSVRTVYIDQMKNIWVGTNKGLALFRPQTEEFISFRHDADNPHSLVAGNVYNICEMNNGELWIAANMGGISILNLHSIALKNPESVQFHNIAASSDNWGLSSNYIHTLFQDSFGNIWIGNHSCGIDFIGKNPPLFQTLPYALEKRGEQQNKPIWGICTDNEGLIWLGSENEIAVFKSNQLMRTINISRNGKFGRIKPNMNDFGFTTFFEDVNGKIWVGTNSGVCSFEHDEICKEDGINSQLTDKMIRSIVRDRQGKLWIGTFGKGISIFDTNNQFIIRLETDNGFCSNAISHLYVDVQGGIWAGTRNGLVYFPDTDKPNHYELYNEKQGLADTYIRAIQEDKAGNIWISSNGSVSLWNRQKQLFDNYDHRDGIPMGNFIEGSAYMTAEGTVYFGSTTGVCRFNPAELVAEYQVAPVQIMQCRVFDRLIESREYEFPVPVENGRIELPYNQNSFRISFSSPDYAQSGQVEYAYMIEGLDNKWYNIQSENQVTFRNLSFGEYTFRVKARLRNHEWDESHIASIFVRIHPPFWLAWYAGLFYAILLCIGVFVIIRFYRYRFHLKSSLEIERKESQNRQELNDERLRFYTNITHELRTPLTLILGPLEDLLNDKNLSGYYNRKIEIIYGSATRLLNLINQILEFRKTETQNRKLTVSKSNLANLVMEIGLRYKEMNRNDKVIYHIDVESKDACIYFDSDMLTTILNNLLSNAVKYTPEGEIRLAMRPVEDKENRYMEIEVSDTGYGIEAKALPHIFDRYYQTKGNYQASGTGIGLALVKSLTDLHEGTIHVESAVGKGTVFTFRILMDNTYPNALHKESLNTRTVDGFTPPPKEEGESDSQPIVLVVEDNADIREYIMSSFTGDYTVITAADGKEGLELAQKHIPNIIVSDIMMPVMDGVELCRAVKEDIRTSHIPLILLTAKDTIRDKEEGYVSGADSYLTKPFSAKLLHSRMNNLLESRRKLACQIAKNMQELKSTKNNKPIKISALDEEFLAKINELVETKSGIDKLDISFIVEKMKMSHSTFYRKIKGLTGISANEFIRRIRLKNSAQLLISGKYNISEVAYMTGFNDIDYFRECFKKEYGLSPKEYLKQQVKDSQST